MSEQIKKINFSALKVKNTDLNKSSEKVTSPPKEVKEITGIGDKTKIQVSLGKKKDILKKDEPIKIEVNKEEIEDTNKEKKSDIKTDIIKKEKEDNISENEIVIPKLIEKSEIKKKTEEVKNGNDKLLKEPENLFNNYESDFTVKQDSIIDKIKKLKDLPKTRPALVFGMLGFLIIGISGLVFISPNDSYLKASVLGVEQKQTIVEENLSEIARQNALELKIKSEEEKIRKIKKEKLENFLLNRNKKSNKLPEKINNIKNKSKEKKLKELLLESKKTK